MSKKRIALITVISLLILGLSLAVYMRWQMKQGRATPPPPGVSILSESVNINADLPKGFIVWSSNRFGNHDILKMNLEDRKITRLTTNPHTEYFPRISPDGKYVVFARSQKPWVSQRNQSLWNIVLINIETGEERELAKNANVPTWSADGKKVYFQNEVKQLSEVDIASGKQRMVFKSGTGEVKQSAELYTPNYNADLSKMAVTLHLGDYTSTIVNKDGEIQKVGWGCQVTWNQKGDAVYYVGHGGKMKNAFYLFDPKTGETTKWLDLPGEFSHEYFPKLSNDEKYLVFAASKGGHEHDSADYEIFLWQVGTPAVSAVRLTFHTGNDNWPDVFLY